MQSDDAITCTLHSYCIILFERQYSLSSIAVKQILMWNIVLVIIPEYNALLVTEDMIMATALFGIDILILCITCP